MDLQAKFDWYAKLSKQPGWRDYVWDAARELAREHPVLFEKLPQMLLEKFPGLSQCTMPRAAETRANTYRLRPERFHAPRIVAHKRKERT